MTNSEKIPLLGLLFLVGIVLGTFNGMRMERHRVNWARDKQHLTIDAQEVPEIEPCWQGCRSDADVTCEKFRMLLR